jgi:hypothetical protein
VACLEARANLLESWSNVQQNELPLHKLSMWLSSIETDALLKHGNTWMVAARHHTALPPPATVTYVTVVAIRTL